MHIFTKSQKNDIEKMELWLVEPGHSFNLFSALAKALLLFLLVYGAIGGFLSAYDMDYNKGFCMLVIFLFSLLICAVYETDIKWLMNLVNLAVLFGYFYIAFSNYWVINSGYYALINRMYEVAREYLGLTGRTEYTLVYEEKYLAVTVFAVFIGIVGCILLNIELQGKGKLFKILLLTFTPFFIPLYFKRTPDVLYVMFLLSGYGTVWMLQCAGVKQEFTRQIRYLLPVATLLSFFMVRVITYICPAEVYSSMVQDNPVKLATEKEVNGYAQFGMMALFHRDSAGGGVSGGRLTNSAAVMPDYETDLKVRYTPYSFQPVYLKAYTGRDYDGKKWSEAEDTMPQDSKMIPTLLARMATYETMPEQQGCGRMEVENIGASKDYQYEPYYTNERMTRQEGAVSIYTYFPSGGPVEIPAQEIDEVYLEVPDRCLPAVKTVCEDGGFAGTPQEIANQIINYLGTNYSYTLRPGTNFRKTDYITHFLLESRKGYCAHFASSAVMMFRYMGIPARYAEGYAFSYYDVVQNGVLLEDANYEDYYSGFAPLGETGVVEMEILDSSAHAWVEIYLEGRGWIVVDPTPASVEEETTSFWDAFRIPKKDDTQMDMEQNVVGEYLETAIDGISYLIIAAIGGLLLFVVIRFLVLPQREKKLSERERVKLSYKRLRKSLIRKDAEFAHCLTINAQLEHLRTKYGAEFTEEQEQTLYQVFFGRNPEGDLEQLEKMVNRLRKKLKMLWKM